MGLYAAVLDGMAVYRAYCVGCGEKRLDLQLSAEEMLGYREGSLELPVRDLFCVLCLFDLNLEVDVETGRAV
jgi:hypothetical protein